MIYNTILKLMFFKKKRFEKHHQGKLLNLIEGYPSNDDSKCFIDKFNDMIVMVSIESLLFFDLLGVIRKK